MHSVVVADVPRVINIQVTSQAHVPSPFVLTGVSHWPIVRAQVG